MGREKHVLPCALRNDAIFGIKKWISMYCALKFDAELNVLDLPSS